MREGWRGRNCYKRTCKNHDTVTSQATIEKLESDV